MIDGSIQDFPLTLNKFLDHAARWHGEAEIVTAREDGSVIELARNDIDADMLAQEGE